MDPGWRLKQIEYNKKARERLARAAGARFWGWEIVMMFYDIVIAVDGYAEMRGIPVPKNHKARRAVVGRHLPHLAELYNGLYSLSLVARYYDGYAMTENAWCAAARCRDALARSIPVQ